MASGLLVRCEGVVSGKKISTFDGERKCRVEVQFMGGTVACVVPDEKFKEIPDEGNAVVLLLTAKCEMGQYGATLKSMKYVGHEVAGGVARPSSLGDLPPRRQAA